MPTNQTADYWTDLEAENARLKQRVATLEAEHDGGDNDAVNDLEIKFDQANAKIERLKAASQRATIATAAMAAIITRNEFHSKVVAQSAIQYADALIKELNLDGDD